MVGSYPLSSQAPTHVEVELGCDNNSNSNGDRFDKKSNWEGLKEMVI